MITRVSTLTTVSCEMVHQLEVEGKEAEQAREGERQGEKKGGREGKEEGRGERERGER